MSNDPDRDRIARRHPDIPQDALIPLPPAGVNVGAASNHRGDGERKTSNNRKTIRQARCPKCWRSNKTVGVIRAVSATKTIEVFKDHDKTIGAGRIPCSGSGEQAPDA